MANLQNNYFWIPVNVFPGMFSSEYSVELNLIDGKKVSFFADKSLIREQAGNKYTLRVVLINRDADKNMEDVMLPYETFETSSRWVTIPINK
jgi:hypothetical protein